ncbi:interleukin-18-like [Dendropsophus ebraccatus]|uniref:interleukin-18-like n=1 Tax=Dendropsophus ebraccatus TaxID=150705 RepID=UPI003831D4F1
MFYQGKISRKWHDVVDAYKQSRSPDNQHKYRVKNLLDELLFICPEDSIAHFRSLVNSKDDKGEPTSFYLPRYCDTTERGYAVAICCEIKGKNYILKAESDSIKLSEETQPTRILEKTSKFIFYQKVFSPGHENCYKFESSSQQGLYLAWDIKEKKLILKRPEGLIDETTKFMLIP